MKFHDGFVLPEDLDQGYEYTWNAWEPRSDSQYIRDRQLEFLRQGWAPTLPIFAPGMPVKDGLVSHGGLVLFERHKSLSQR